MFVWLRHQPPQYASKAVVQLENQQQRLLGKVEDVQPKRFIWETVSKNVLAIYDDAFRAKHAGLWNRPREIAA
jgi:hypothetical protein